MVAICQDTIAFGDLRDVVAQRRSSLKTIHARYRIDLKQFQAMVDNYNLELALAGKPSTDIPPPEVASLHEDIEFGWQKTELQSSIVLRAMNYEWLLTE